MPNRQVKLCNWLGVLSIAFAILVSLYFTKYNFPLCDNESTCQSCTTEKFNSIEAGDLKAQMEAYEKTVGENDMKDKNLQAELDRKVEENARTTRGYDRPYQEGGTKSEVMKPITQKQLTYSEIFNELEYTDHNHLPMASGYKSHDYEYGYSYLPPEKWYPQPVRPPICITDKPLNFVPALTPGAPADLKEFHSSNHLLPPTGMAMNYIYDKVNTN